MKKPSLPLLPLLDHYALPWPVSWPEIFGRSAPLEVEIGFGRGEVLIRNAQKIPDTNFIGIEQDWERILKALSQISQEQKLALKRLYGQEGFDQHLKNIRILKIDARLAFHWFFREKMIRRVECLFPCPWPKKGHVKHRLFSNDFLKLVNSRLIDAGEIRVVTDHKPFQDWILGEVEETGFSVQTNKIKPQFDTKFERKWRAAGQEEFYALSLKKVNHISYATEEKIDLQVYKLDDFDPEAFKFEALTGETTIVLKDKLYDSIQKRMLLHVIVAEPELTQHFWIEIKKGKSSWQVCRSDGQNFFYTPGMAMALNLVYRSALKK